MTSKYMYIIYFFLAFFQDSLFCCFFFPFDVSSLSSNSPYCYYTCVCVCMHTGYVPGKTQYTIFAFLNTFYFSQRDDSESHLFPETATTITKTLLWICCTFFIMHLFVGMQADSASCSGEHCR